MLGIGLTSLILSKRRLALTDVLLFIGTGAAGLISVRHIPIFAIVTSPIIARYLLASLEGTQLYPVLSGKLTTRMTGRLHVLNWLVLLVALIVAITWVSNKVLENDSAVEEHFPVEAVDYLERSGLGDQKGYNSYNWGGYLIWRGIPVFVDGRADVYGDEFLHHYRLTFDLTSSWQEPLDEFDVDYVLIESSNSLSTLLTVSDQWRRAYGDDVATIYLRAR
jgi:hypothetical protein